MQFQDCRGGKSPSAQRYSNRGVRALGSCLAYPAQANVAVHSTAYSLTSNNNFQSLLHDLVTTALTDCDESVLFENPANLRARKNPKPTQPVPRFALRTLHCGIAGRFRKGLRSQRTR